MKERPILFSAEMVRALLEGRKTQTRRVLKVKGCRPFVPDNTWDIDTISKWNKDYHPYGKVGDLLWVRESFMMYPGEITPRMMRRGADTWPKAAYVADCSAVELEQYAEWGWKKKPSIHMPKALARIWLRVMSVRVERLHDVSEEDAMAEGMDFRTWDGVSGGSRSFRNGFISTWCKINGSESWNANPWVWVVEFEKVNS